MTSSRLCIGLLFTGGVCCLAQDSGSVRLKVVQNAPFSAEAVTESSQTLEDGNRITSKMSATIVRDSEGRTRREQRNSKGMLVVFIHDPVAGVAYVLDPVKKSARKIAVATGDKAAEPTDSNGESLGSDLIEGFQADGARTTQSFSPGTAGNERPFSTVIEAWYSRELQAVVLRKATDPRVGQTVYRLVNIQRAEPDRTLFEVPTDYVVRNLAP